MKFQDNPSRVALAHMIGQKVIVQVFGKLKLDDYNPFAPPRPSGKRTWGILQEHSETEVKVSDEDGEVIFRPDHVGYTSTFRKLDGTELEVYHLHRGQRDDYEYGAPK
jgi:hypothetical protein